MTSTASNVASRLSLALGAIGCATLAFAATACTQPEAPKALPPAGMAGAPSSLGQHGSVPSTPPVAAASQPAGHVAQNGIAPPAGHAASQPAPNFPTIVPGSGAPPPQGAVAEPTHAGVVTEAMDAADYTYMKIKKDNGKEEWTATTRTAVKVGDRVVVSESLVMHDFKSKSLNRTFPRIIFGTRK